MIDNRIYLAAAIGVGVIVLIALTIFVRKKRRQRALDKARYIARWKELQKHCATRKTWPQAIIEADKLLDEALKQRHYKGKTTGERLVAAQHELSANEDVWFSHKYCDEIAEEDVRRLKKQDIIDALSGFRQALRDLGALD